MFYPPRQELATTPRVSPRTARGGQELSGRTNEHKHKRRIKMNRTKMLVASATAVLMAGIGIAIAQQEPPHSAPAETIAPPGAKQPSAMPHQNGGASNAPAVRNEGPNASHKGEASQSRGRSETTGQAPREDRNQATEQNKNKSDQGRSKTERTEQNRTTEQAPHEERKKREYKQNKSDQGRSKTERTEQNRTTGQAPHEDRTNRASEQNKSEQGRSKTERTEQNRTTGQAPREDRTNRASEQNKSEQDRARTERTEQNRTTTGQGAAGTRTNVNVNITPEKRTQIHEVIVKERSAPRVTSVNFDLSVGARVPRSVRFVALPSTIVAIEPDLRGYDYFMVGDRIVVINPRSMEIVAIIDV